MDESILPALRATTKLYLSGPFGAGKTTLAVERIRWLLGRERTRGDEILVLVPQRTVAQPYLAALRGPDAPPGPPVQVTTVAGLARSAVELYWPLLASQAGFADTRREPVFLNLETAQYHMASLIDAAFASGELDGVRLERNRVITQVLDNLNKAALLGMTLDETYTRLELAVPIGDQRAGQLNALRAAKRISQEFRALCLHQTLVDFSLQMELFNRYVLGNEWSRTHLLRAYRHLIVDNVEEATATAHRLIALWLPQLESALIVADEDAGFRLFLGADPEGTEELAAACDLRLRLDESYLMSPQLAQMAQRVDAAIRGRRPAHAPQPGPSRGRDLGLPALRLPETGFRFYPQMLQWVVDQVHHLTGREGVAPGQIAIIAPFVSDALRFSLQSGLAVYDIPSTTHRPSRALQDEPAARCLLTLAALAHPDWGIRPPPADVAQALSLAVARLDPIRAHLLTQAAYPAQRRTIELDRFAELKTDRQQRITFAIGAAYARLRDWLYAYRSRGQIVALDQFFALLFGEVLSQPGFGFHDDFDAARVANQLVESARNFRWALEETAGRAVAEDGPLAVRLGRDYLHLVASGAIGALYVPGWQEPADAVFIAPAYTFLMRNRAVEIQFWLDIGSTGWWERLYQPLTHPYVLSARWPAGRPWTDLEEYQTRQQALRRLLLGLLRRTRRQVYLGISDYGESGFEQRGALLTLINRLLLESEDPGTTGVGPGSSLDAAEEGFFGV
jgi:superfamily I DNA/RNA helicase